MIYLSHFEFPDYERETDFLFGLMRTCYDTVYPFQILSKHNLSPLPFFTVETVLGKQLP